MSAANLKDQRPPINSAGTRENVYHAPEDVEINLDISLKNLGFDYGNYTLSSFMSLGLDTCAHILL